jgi:hypothetical protein
MRKIVNAPMQQRAWAAPGARRAVRIRGRFARDAAATKLIYLALRDVEESSNVDRMARRPSPVCNQKFGHRSAINGRTAPHTIFDSPDSTDMRAI